MVRLDVGWQAPVVGSHREGEQRGNNKEKTLLLKQDRRKMVLSADLKRALEEGPWGARGGKWDQVQMGN